jgi:RND family efflux transporter MFP subunit
MKKTIYIVLALALAALVVLRLKNNKETTLERVFQYDKNSPVSVQVDTIRQKRIDTQYSYPGTFEPIKETKISAEIQGKINSVPVDMGSIVKAGQTLIQIDNSLLKLQLQSIEVQIEGLLADVKRYSVLAKADAIQGVQLEKAELGLKSAEVQKAILLEQINKTSIKAPFNGIVTAKMTEMGAFASPGMPLLQITDISRLKFTINIPDNELDRFVMGQNHKLTTDASPEINLTAEVSMIGSKANPGNSYTVQLSVDNTPDLMIKSGMSGQVNISNGNNDKLIYITASSIVGTSIKPQVYLITNGKAKLKNIIISERFENKVVVAEGLEDGNLIATTGFINLFDGANVTIK